MDRVPFLFELRVHFLVFLGKFFDLRIEFLLEVLSLLFHLLDLLGQLERFDMLEVVESAFSAEEGLFSPNPGLTLQ